MPSTTTPTSSHTESIERLVGKHIDHAAPPAVHRSFSWLFDEDNHDQAAQFMALTMDVCNGIQTCLELVHSGDLTRRINEDADSGEEVADTLSRLDRERLLLLATASARMLAGDAECRIAKLNNEVMGCRD